MKRSATCDGCCCVIRIDADPEACMWPCSRFGFADLLQPRGIVARRRWLMRRGVYQVQPHMPGDDVEIAPLGRVAWTFLEWVCSWAPVEVCDGCRGPLDADAEEQGEAGSAVLCGACIREAQAEGLRDVAVMHGGRMVDVGVPLAASKRSPCRVCDRAVEDHAPDGIAGECDGYEPTSRP